MINTDASTARLDAIADPTDDDLFATEDVEDVDTLDAPDEDDDWTWEDDYSPRDDRYDGDGIPSWSAWA